MLRSISTVFACLLLAFATLVAQTATAPPPAQISRPEEAKQPPLSRSQISQLEQKAKAGDPNAQATLGKAYRDGNGVPKNLNVAVQWIRKAAEQGVATAENDLGIMYGVGDGVERDKEEAIRWYKKAALQGYAKAMFNLGASYYNGDGVGSDDVASYAWFLLSKEAGDSAADEALRRANSEGVSLTEGCLRLAQMYETGTDVPKNSAESLKWYRRAADAGHAQSNVKVAALLLAPGRNPTAEEYAEAHHRCEEASKTYSPGAYCLVMLYRRGIGVAKDPVEAVKWLNRAAELGHARSLLELGEAYQKGDGVKADPVEAYKWICLAYISKVPGAEEVEAALRQELNPREMAQAKQKAVKWSNEHHFLGLRYRAADPVIAPAQK